MGRMVEIWARQKPVRRHIMRTVASRAHQDHKAIALLRRDGALSRVQAEKRLSELRRGAADSLKELATALGVSESSLRAMRRKSPLVRAGVIWWLQQGRRSGGEFESLRQEWLRAASLQKERVARQKSRTQGRYA